MRSITVEGRKLADDELSTTAFDGRAEVAESAFNDLPRIYMFTLEIAATDAGQIHKSVHQPLKSIYPFARHAEVSTTFCVTCNVRKLQGKVEITMDSPQWFAEIVGRNNCELFQITVGSPKQLGRTMHMTYIGKGDNGTNWVWALPQRNPAALQGELRMPVWMVESNIARRSKSLYGTGVGMVYDSQRCTRVGAAHAQIRMEI